MPGCIFINNGRYWWRIKLPGEAALRRIGVGELPQHALMARSMTLWHRA
jgi:hypothetical protein